MKQFSLCGWSFVTASGHVVCRCCGYAGPKNATVFATAAVFVDGVLPRWQRRRRLRYNRDLGQCRSRSYGRHGESQAIATPRLCRKRSMALWGASKLATTGRPAFSALGAEGDFLMLPVCKEMHHVW